MNSEQDQQKNLIDTTDCLEAVGVFRGWKNFLFIVVILCLLLLQVSFWLVNTGYVATEQVGGEAPAAASPAPPAGARAGDSEQAAEAKENIKKAAEQVAAAPDKPTEAAPQQPKPKPAKHRFGIEFKHLVWLIRFVDFVLILAAVLYCLTILFSLKISLVGRLGGINHICRAFFLSLVFLVLLLPWQKFFGGVVTGAIYTPRELARWYTVETTGGIFGIVAYYLRFTGYWLLVLLLLIFSHIRSSRWAKAILRRLEVI